MELAVKGRLAVAAMAVMLCALAVVDGRTAPEPVPDMLAIGTTRVAIQTLFGEVSIGLYTKVRARGAQKSLT
jgi:hypothetical protein